MTEIPCSHCHERRHVRHIVDGKSYWSPCPVCFRTVTSSSIDPVIREGVAMPEPDHPVFPFDQRVTVTGPVESFKRHVWASLLRAPVSLRISSMVMTLDRLLDIKMAQDPEYKSIYEVIPLHLLVLFVLPNVYSNKFLPSVIETVLVQRAGRATWIHCGLERHELIRRCDGHTALADILFRTQVPPTSHGSDPAPAPLRSEVLADGSAIDAATKLYDATYFRHRGGH